MSTTGVTWDLLARSIAILDDLERFTIKLDTAARAKEELPTPPSDLLSSVTRYKHDVNLALAVRRECE